MPKTKPIASYADLKAELDQIMDQLQREDLDVDAAIVHYERGRQLIKELEQYLKTAENKVTKLKAKADNQPS